MANTTMITGASDDLIELEGQITQEFPHGGDENALLAFSDGTVLEVEYDSDGIWRIKQLAKGACEYSHKAGDVQADTFDEVALTGDLRWVVKAERDADGSNPTFATP